MVRPSKCPGCKTLKSKHVFGSPGKHCTGPDSDAEDFADQGNESTTLASVLSAVQALAGEVKELKADNAKFKRSLSSPENPPVKPSTPVGTGKLTLPELRGMSDLAGKAEQRLATLGLCNDMDSSDSDENTSARGRPSQSGASGKLKSGKEAKPTSSVLYPQFWPHTFLCLTHAQREVKYEDLSMAEFVAGFVQILQSQELSTTEVVERQKHLISLMYLS